MRPWSIHYTIHTLVLCAIAAWLAATRKFPGAFTPSRVGARAARLPGAYAEKMVVLPASTRSTVLVSKS